MTLLHGTCTAVALLGALTVGVLAMLSAAAPTGNRVSSLNLGYPTISTSQSATLPSLGQANRDAPADPASATPTSAATPGPADAPSNSSTSASDGASAASTPDLGTAAPGKSPTNPSSIQFSYPTPLDHVYIYTSKPAPSSRLTNPVFKQGVLVGQFNACTSDLTEPAEQHCFIDDAYNNRLEFSITFNMPSHLVRSAFEERPPRIELNGESSIAQPEVYPSLKDQDSTASVFVHYGCQPMKSGTLSLTLTIAFGPGSGGTNATIIRWQKMCQSGVNDKMDFGYLSRDSQGSQVLNHFGNETSALLAVSPTDLSTELYMKLSEAGAVQPFKSPFVTTSNPDIVNVTVRGNHPHGGLIFGLELSSPLQVGYVCNLQGEAVVQVTVAIPPFNNISATWSKDCGGSTASTLNVGSVQKGMDIVDAGKPTPQFKVGVENIGTEHSDQHLHLPGNQSDWTFFISNDDEKPTASRDTPLRVGRITATVEHRDVLMQTPLTVEREYAFGWKSASGAQNDLEPGSSLRVKAHFICKKVGESRILFTVPVLGHRELEFGIAKECTRVGTAHKSGEFVFTVSSVFWLAIATVVCVLSFLYVRRKTTQRMDGFEPVSTGKR